MYMYSSTDRVRQVDEAPIATQQSHYTQCLLHADSSVNIYKGRGKVNLLFMHSSLKGLSLSLSPSFNLLGVFCQNSVGFFLVNLLFPCVFEDSAIL